jgi:titin
VEAINHGGASPPALSPAVDLPDPNWPAPSDLTLRVTSNGNVEAVWTDNTSDEVRFELWRAIGDGGFAFKENVPPAGGVGSRVSAVDDTVELGQRYRFKVRAIRSQSNSAFSPVAEITVPVTVCCGPSDLALRITSNGNVEAEWTDNSDDEDLFEMWRSTDGQSFSFKENVPYRSGSGSRTSAVDDTVEDNRTYWFKVRALRGGKPTAFSNASSIDVPSRAPASLSLRVTSNRNVEAEWTDHTGDEERFELWRSTDGSNFFLKENVPAQPGVGTRANAVDTTVALGHTYWYKVRAIRSGNPTGFSNTETITVPSTMAGGPTDLSLRITSTRSVEATWTDNSSDEDRFELYRSNNGTDFSLEENVPAEPGQGARASAVDTTAYSGARYYWYKVRAIRAGLPTDFSNIESIYVPTRAPTNLTLRVTSANNVEATWTDNTSDELRFELWRSTDGSSFAKEENVPAKDGVGTRTSAVDSTVLRRRTY